MSDIQEEELSRLQADEQETETQTEKTLVEIMAETEAEVSRAKEQERTTIRKRKFLEMFDKTLGIIGAACQAAGITRTTYYDWKETDPAFKKAVDRIIFVQSEAVEDKLIQNIGKNNTSSIHFYLSRRHPLYRQKLESDVVQTNIPADLAGKSVEELLAEADAIRNRINRYRQGDSSSLRPDTDA